MFSATNVSLGTSIQQSKYSKYFPLKQVIYCVLTFTPYLNQLEYFT